MEGAPVTVLVACRTRAGKGMDALSALFAGPPEISTRELAAPERKP